ncbi:MAG: hypothetical protein R2851_04870 [Caldilineaceae bacterium]
MMTATVCAAVDKRPRSVRAVERGHGEQFLQRHVEATVVTGALLAADDEAGIAGSANVLPASRCRRSSRRGWT